MGIAFQKSCYLAPDVKVGGRTTHKLKRATRRKLMRKRRKQLNAILEEARLWSFALLLPTTVFANHEAVHELDTTIQTITAKLLGKHISKDKIDGVFGKIARNILVPGITNVDAGYEYYPTSLPDTDMLDDTLVPAHVLDHLYQECPEYRTKHPAARTWREIRAHADAYTVADEPLQYVLEELQFEDTCFVLGLPHMFSWSSRAERKILALLQSSDPSKLANANFVQQDFVVIKAVEKDNPEEWWASMNTYNIITLYPKFFESIDRDGHGSIRDLYITPGESNLGRIEPGAVTLLLHETTHSKSVLHTDDHTLEYNGPCGDWLDDSLLTPEHVTDSVTADRDAPNLYISYGIEACLALARRDLWNNTNKAEDNADSWALYALLRMLIYAYPDLDILGAIDEEDPSLPRNRIIQARDTLLHHCTLFECLRHPDAGLISDHPDYNASKDPWAAHSGRKKPATVKELLDVVQGVARRPENNTVRNRRKKQRRRQREKEARDKQREEERDTRKTEDRLAALATHIRDIDF